MICTYVNEKYMYRHSNLVPYYQNMAHSQEGDGGDGSISEYTE